MDNEYDYYQGALEEAFIGITEKDNPTDYKYLLKGDISGIQEFIFNIPSKGAARLLKARSFFIQAVTKMAIEKIKDNLTKTTIISDAGGSFYLSLKTLEEEKIHNIKDEINKDLNDFGLYLSIVYTESSNNWKTDCTKIKPIEERQKFQKYNNNSAAFEPQQKAKDEETEITTWKNFAKELSQATHYNITKCTTDNNIKIEETKFSLFGYSFELSTNGDYLFNDKDSQTFIMKELPVWQEDNPYLKEVHNKESNAYQLEENLKAGYKEGEYEKPKEGELIGLDHLELQAKHRTGTGKIGTLKLDIDNLGTLFRDRFNSLDKYKKASKALSFFFGKHLYSIWEKEHFSSYNEKYAYKDNILVIFSGGDDCFIIGGWDAVLEFTKKLHEEFEGFIKNNESLTFSAGILILNGNYPVIRIGEETEHYLEKAKGRKNKNSICLFGEAFSWSELDSISELSTTLFELVTDEENPENKSLLQKIRLSAKGYQSLMNNIKTSNQVNFQKVWNLTWFILRNVREENKEKVDSDIIQKYHDAILNAMQNNQYSSALVYPAAARWAELLTRKI
ncbi:MAG: type III-A CRISPR-associated protein Cas10/Csm1 [Hyphomicrobiales bacterium]